VLRWVLRILPVVILLVAGAQTFHWIEQYLIESPRFQLSSVEDYEGAAPRIEIQGIQHASRENVESVFAEDAGTSLYMFPLAERRRRLLAINWVKDATVSRIWPNRVRVSVREREPVAFVQLSQQQDGGRQVALIDEDGVLLEPPLKSDYDLPVLRGIEERQQEPARASRVGRAMALLAGLGPLADRISEVDTAHSDNLAVTMSVAGNPVTLQLGRKNFRSRIEHFLAHYAEIQRRVPDTTTFDLRIDDRITAVNGVSGGA
jgi:cell division protein FtsQ